MGAASKIEWTDATWNPWQGCTKVSPACAHCYMFTDMARYGKDPSVVRRSKEPTFRLPLKRKRTGEYAIPPGSKVFTCSWSDWFHADADPWRDEAWAIIRERRDLIFQIVTKRTERIPNCLPADWGEGYPNVCLIATVENQEWADVRISQLLQVPAMVRGLSIEPLLGPLDLTQYLAPHSEGEWLNAIECGKPWSQRIRWVIVGGESGPGARPMHSSWVLSLLSQCVATGVPFFFKQWGEWLPIDQAGIEVLTNADKFAETGVLQSGLWGDQVTREVCDAQEDLPMLCYRVGKKAAGRLLDYREWNEFPEVAHA